MEFICQNRKNHLELIENRARGLLEGYRQNIAVIGDEMVGKTSLITEFIKRFHDNRLITLYLQTRPESIKSFAARFIGVLLYNFLSNSDIPLKEDLDFLILKSEKYIPRTIEQIRAILSALEKRKKASVFTELLSLCDSIHQETQKSCLVIFDEFNHLEKLGLANLYRDWSKLIVSQKNTMYIITSSLRFRTKNILSKELSLLFGNFEVINVEPFTISSTDQYITNRLGSYGVCKGVKNFLTHFTGGSPFYLNLITEEMIKSKQTRLSQILQKLLFDSSGLLNQRFSVYIGRFGEATCGKEYLDIIHMVACGHNKIKDISHIMKKKACDLNKRIAFLLESDIISRNADFLRLNDRVFGFWMRFVHRQKQEALLYDENSLRIRFLEQVEGLISDFLGQVDKPMVERMTELLRHFEDETIQIEKKKIRLNHFREIKPLELQSANIKEGLLGRSNEGIWLIAIKHDCLTENDVAEFSRECKKYRNKLERKIIVTNSEIDANARLRALEEKVWAMDLNSLNQIFDLFCMPRVTA